MTLLIIEAAKLAPMIRTLYRTFIGPETAKPIKVGHTLAGIGLVVLVGLAAITVRLEKSGLAMPIGVLSVLPLLLTWRSPIWAWRLMFFGLVAFPLLERWKDSVWPWNPVQVVASVVVVFMVGLREPLGVILTAGLATLAGIWLHMLPDHAAGSSAILAVILLLGEQIQLRRRATQKLVMENERSELLIERARIARELHDVVAHSMSLVAVRAETAPYRLPDLPESGRAEFIALAGTARDSLIELRRLLGVLRTDESADRAPQPTLSDVEELIETMQAAGMDIHTELGEVEVPAGTGLTAYRIVQEALSNAARHAQGAKVTVTVASIADGLLVHVVNEPPLTTRASRGGHGLRGMQERVALVGGTLHFGPTPSGGFEVRAVLP